MKMIFEKYGATIISGIVIFALLLIITEISYNGKKGIYSIMGNAFEKESKTYDNPDDELALKEYHDKVLPIIELVNSGFIKANHQYKLEDLFNCYSVENKTVVSTLQILKIVNVNNETDSYNFDKTSKTLTFNKTGMYKIYVQVHDDDYVYNEEMFKCFVSN